jgi:NADH:ubiquinone oxidoreductase subunit 5 (subunit L)/multisubunit Na+/H+ antiporter MnhA subunit
VTSDQWFTFSIATLSVVGVLGGFLVGAYISRKARAATRAYRPEEDDPEAVWLTVGLACALLVVSTILVVLWAMYQSQRADLDVACHGVVANLDLTEWVALCRS